MVVVSQIWVQCTRCTSIIGHVHMRVGSELEPELGGSLYTALVVALSEMEQSGTTHQQYAVSGVYGYRIPDNEGVGLFTHTMISLKLTQKSKKSIPALVMRTAREGRLRSTYLQ